MIGHQLEESCRGYTRTVGYVFSGVVIRSKSKKEEDYSYCNAFLLKAGTMGNLD